MRYIYIIMILFASCKAKKVEERETLFLTDTTVRVNADTAVVVPVKPARVAPVRHTHAPSAWPRTATPRSVRQERSAQDNTTNYPVREEKKGWSKAAKGAVIGGVVGAGTGAVITKSGKGAVVGGVVGAAGGYIIGRSKDKKDGRIN